MRNLIRQPLTWMVIAECVVVALLIAVVWSVVAAAATQHGGPPLTAVEAPAVATDSQLPDFTGSTGRASSVQLPGLNLGTGFWRGRLQQLNADQVFFEQLEWRVTRSAMEAAQAYLETVVLPSVLRAEGRA